MKLIFILLLNSTILFAQRPIAPLETIENNYPVIPVQKVQLCLPIEFQIPSNTNFASKLCSYYKGHYADGNMVFPYPLVYTIDVDYQIWRDEPFSIFSFNNDALSLVEKIYYTADGMVIINAMPINAQCGWDDEMVREVEIGFDSKIGFSTNYSLSSTTTPRKIVVPDKFRCLVTLFNRDITDNILPLLEKTLNTAGNDIDKIVPNFTSFKKHADFLWNEMHKPIRVINDSWLTLNPKGISGGKITGNNNTVSTTIGFIFEPQIINGSEPSTVSEPLPPLELKDCNPGVSLYPEYSTSFTKLEEIISEKVQNTEYQKSWKQMTISNIKSYSNDQDVILSVDIKLRPSTTWKQKSFINKIKYYIAKVFYRKDRTLYFRGKPQLDGNGTIHLNGLNFDANTKEKLESREKWILNSNLLSELDNSSKIGVKYYFEDFSKLLSNRINYDFDEYQVRVNNLNSNGEKVYIFQDKIICRYKTTFQIDAIHK